MSLRRRLTLLSAIAVAIAVALVSVIVYVLVRDQLIDQVDDTLEERAEAATLVGGGRAVAILGGSQDERPPGVPLPETIKERAEELGVDPEQILPPPPGVQADPERPGGPDAGENRVFVVPAPPRGEFVPRGQIIDAGGAIERTSEGGLPISDEAQEVAAGEREPFFSNLEVGGSELRVLTTSAGEDMALQIARPLDEVNNTLDDLVLILIAITIGGVALGGGLGLLVARTSLAPAAAVAGAAQEVAETQDLTRRIEVRGSDELGRMAASFNAMMEALERSVGAQRQLVADASHELRTPLATLRTNLDTLTDSKGLKAAERKQILADLGAEMEELSALVGDVVELAREPSEGTAVREEVRLDELAAAAVERARRRARGLEFTEKLEPTVVSADPARLDRAIGNLLDNAIKWSPEGGEVEIEVADGRVRVRDHGSGFKKSDLPHAFERFYRADEARGTPGSGLGLAIVQRIAEQHGGSAKASNARGGGAAVELELPPLNDS